MHVRLLTVVVVDCKELVISNSSSSHIKTGAYRRCCSRRRCRGLDTVLAISNFRLETIVQKRTVVVVDWTKRAISNIRF